MKKLLFVISLIFFGTLFPALRTESFERDGLTEMVHLLRIGHPIFDFIDDALAYPGSIVCYHIISMLKAHGYSGVIPPLELLIEENPSLNAAIEELLVFINTDQCIVKAQSFCDEYIQCVIQYSKRAIKDMPER